MKIRKGTALNQMQVLMKLSVGWKYDDCDDCIGPMPDEEAYHRMVLRTISVMHSSEPMGNNSQKCVLMIVLPQSVKSNSISISSGANIVRRFDRSAYGKPPGQE